MKRSIGWLAIASLFPTYFLIGCNRNISLTIVPEPRPNQTMTATGTAIRSVTGTVTATRTYTVTATATKTTTNTVMITATATPTNTATVTPALGQSPQAMVVLASAANYGALSASGITNSGATTICGGLGSTTPPDPGGIQVNCGGPTDFANGAASTAENDLGVAYADAQGRTGGAIIPAGADIGGQTFYEGLYTCTGSLNIASSDVYLDAQGDPNAVFIFQVNGGALNNLVVGPGRQVHLTNGSQADHVFWAVSGYCSLDTTVQMVGNIMAWSQITFNTGANLEGRALAATANITFLANIISFP